MEVNENTVLQNGKMEDEYVRIGTTLFRILNQPMMNGSFRKMRVEWKMSVFRQDHSKDEAAQIPKYARMKRLRYPSTMDSAPCPAILTTATT